MKRLQTIFMLIMLFTGTAFSQQWGLYTFYSPQNTSTAYLVDTNGTTYKSWTGLTGSTGYSAYFLKGDTICRSVTYSGNVLSGGGMTGRVQKLTWAGTVVWDYTYSSSTYCLHHDICPMPNGNVLVISYDVKTAAEATQAGASSSATIWSEKIMELKPNGTNGATVVWEWKLWDHLCQNYNSSKDNYVTSIVNNPQLMNLNYKTGTDRFHMNGIDYNATLDQITVSMHNTNELYVIDHSTTTAQAAGHTGGNSGKGGDFLYRWGNPAAYSASGTTNFNVIHDAHWIPSDCPNANSLVGFNNQGGTGGKSAIDRIEPPYDGYNYSLTLGQAYLPSTYNSRFTSAYSTSNEGNSQQLPNGNQMMCIAMSGYIYEISPTGTSLWSKTVSGTVAHAYRYDKCYVRGPLASTTVSSASVCSGTAVTLGSSAISPTETSPTYTYAWSSSPTGFTSAVQNPSTTPTVTTTYTVTITNTALGCSSTSSKVVIVNPVPVADAGSDVTISSGQSATLNANSGTGYSYSWSSSPAGFTSTSQNPVVSPTVTTTYTLTVTSSGCMATDQVVVTVSGSSTLSVSTSASPNTLCSGNSSTLGSNPSGGSGYTYAWSSNPAGFTSSLQNPVVSPTVTTVYTVTVTSGSNTATSSVTVTVNESPVADAGSDVSILSGESATLSAASGTGYSYSWSANPSGFTSSLQNPVVSPTITTTYSLTVTSGGCTSTDQVIVIVLGSSLSAIASSNPTAVCPGIASQLNVAAYNGTTYSYEWSSDPAGFTSTLQNPVVNPTITTTYTVTVTSGGNSTTSSVTVTVFAPVVPVITQVGNTLSSSSASSYQWYYEGNVLFGETNQTLNPAQNGNYTVVVYDINGCLAVSDPFNFIDVTGINSLNSEENLNVFPNPTSGLITLEGEMIKGKTYDVTVFDIFGKTILKVSNHNQLDLGEYPRGCYYLSVCVENTEIAKRKIIVIK